MMGDREAACHGLCQCEPVMWGCVLNVLADRSSEGCLPWLNPIQTEHATLQVCKTSVEECMQFTLSVAWACGCGLDVDGSWMCLICIHWGVRTGTTFSGTNNWNDCCEMCSAFSRMVNLRPNSIVELVREV